MARFILTQLDVDEDTATEETIEEHGLDYPLANFARGWDHSAAMQGNPDARYVSPSPGFYRDYAAGEAAAESATDYQHRVSTK